jgi:transcriptional regulator of NAD metabolism
MKNEYLNSIKKQFEYYKSVGEKTFIQLDEKDLFWEYNEESNSIAIIVNHLWGNMKSRWTNFLTSDGEKVWRNRESEFEAVIKSKHELLEKWNEGWQCLFDSLDSVTEDNFETKIYIRNQEHSIVEAINRQLAHYSYHIGQLVYIGRMIQAMRMGKPIHSQREIK